MSKFLKFKLALSLDETIEYLSLKSGEAVSLDTIELLFFAGHLSPITGYGRHIVGFKKDAFEKLLDGQECPPYVHSMIGCPCDFGFSIGEVLTSHAKTTDGEDLFFAKTPINPKTGRHELRAKYNELTLESLDPTNRNEWSFPTSQVHRISQLINSEDFPCIVTDKNELLIHIDQTIGTPQVSEIRGLPTPFKYNTRRTISPAESTQTDPPSYKLTITALLELLNTPKRQARNQSGVIAEILEKHPNIRGLSKRNLEEVFSNANKYSRNILDSPQLR